MRWIIYDVLDDYYNDDVDDNHDGDYYRYDDYVFVDYTVTCWYDHYLHMF